MTNSAAVVIFCGPSLPETEARALLPSALIVGPAACGDVFKAVKRGARLIGIIDGYFEHHLSVWHKEVLWAMSEGVRVYGAASMGALRAAELHPFGMVGVGEVFRAFCEGSLEDDDEVAVLHSDLAHGHAALSDAMVNIRATLRRALAEGAISRAAHDAVVQVSKRTFYQERSLRHSVEAAAPELSSSDAASLRAWLRESCLVDQKRLDAIQLLEVMCVDLTNGVSPTTPAFHFENTDGWQTLLRNVAATRDASTA